MSRGVPVELTTFVGRRRELTEGRRMLRAAPLVTLVGPGGVGKTRLAQRMAHQVEGTFPDGVAWVDLAAQHDPASVAGQAATALGVDPQGQPAEAALTTYVQSRQVLIVLDNCEHLVEACGQLAATLLGATPEARILVTSRQALGLPAEHLMNIEPLSVPTSEEASSGKVGHIDAVALLTDRVRAHDPRFRIDAHNAAAASRLCRRLDGIPLAIELAAARLRVLSLRQVVDRLDDRFDLLTTGSRTALPRHQTLQGLIDWSYELCSPAEQVIWARISVFEGGAEMDAVEAVCAEPGSSTRELLDGLVDKSIVTITHSDDRDRFRMLETIREYGAERLAERGEAELMRARHLDHYLARTKESRAAWFGPDQLDLVARTTSDLGNLRAAFDHALAQPGEPAAALDLLNDLVWFWAPAGALDEGTRWFARAVPEQEAEDQIASSTLLRAIANAFYLASQRRDVETGLRLGRRALALPAPEPTPADRAARHLAGAYLATITSDHENALAEYHLALLEFRAAGDLPMQVDVLYAIAAAMDFLGRRTEAATFLAEAMRLCDAHGERFERRFVLEFYGVLQRRGGHEEEALTTVRASLTAWPVLHPGHVATALYAIAIIHRETDEKRRAAVLLGARVRIRDKFGFALPPFEPEGLERLEKQLSGALGEHAFRSAYDEGYAMTLEEAVQFALGQEATMRSRRQMGGASPLSKREYQVAELVARGLSNKDIAAKLVISARTAEGHVAKVMDKLGVRSREQVAAWLTAERSAQE